MQQLDEFKYKYTENEIVIIKQNRDKRYKYNKLLRSATDMR